MTPVDLAWMVATHRGAVLAAVEDRLAAAGAVTELRQFYGLSAQEMDVLIHREIHEPAPAFPQPPASSTPQAGRDGVAA